MKKVYLQNKDIKLRAPEPEDLDIIYAIENDTQLWDISYTNAPLSKYVLKKYIETSHCDLFIDQQLRFMIALIKNDTIMGTIDISDYDHLHNRAEVGINILEEYQHKGIANQALSLLCEYCFDYLHLKQLYAYIPFDNKPSLKLFYANGFKKSGLLKEWLQTGKEFKDVIFVQKIGL